MPLNLAILMPLAAAQATHRIFRLPRFCAGRHWSDCVQVAATSLFGLLRSTRAHGSARRIGSLGMVGRGSASQSAAVPTSRVSNCSANCGQSAVLGIDRKAPPLEPLAFPLTPERSASARSAAVSPSRRRNDRISGSLHGGGQECPPHNQHLLMPRCTVGV